MGASSVDGTVSGAESMSDSMPSRRLSSRDELCPIVECWCFFCCCRESLEKYVGDDAGKEVAPSPLPEVLHKSKNPSQSAVIRASLGIRLVSKMKAKSKFYAVRQGRRPGIYSTWYAAINDADEILIQSSYSRKDCSAQVNQHQGAVFKSFATFSDAQAFLLPSGGAAAPVETLQPSTSTNGQSSIAIKKSTFQFFTQSIAGSSSSLAVKDTSLSNADDQILSIWTDGACRGNGTRRAKAGYGVYFGPKDPRNLSEKLEGPVQTNNRAELTVLFEFVE